LGNEDIRIVLTVRHSDGKTESLAIYGFVLGIITQQIRYIQRYICLQPYVVSVEVLIIEANEGKN
jgi:hypothetical protein